ncbi:MAG TPA: transcriptional regulator [Methanomassiliicoccales archaeon]|nr:transcriptional regulator [Methanomassiliicoccales archaeon]
MQREDLIRSVRELLLRSGFKASMPIKLRSISFDIVARRDQNLLLIKILTNIDAFSKDNAEELKVLAEALGGSIVLVGERSGSGDLEQGIVYSRFDIPIIAFATLKDLLVDDEPPFIFAAPGGLYVRLDSELLHRVREERSLSLGTLAEVAGVSRRTIQMYETGMGAMIDAALRLEEYLGKVIVVPVDPLGYKPPAQESKALDMEKCDDFSKNIYTMLMQLGLLVKPTVKCPFEALTVDRDLLILTGLGKDESRLADKARMVSDLSNITGKESVIFIERLRTRHSIEGTALIGRDELKKIHESERLRKMVNVRSEVDARD